MLGCRRKDAPISDKAVIFDMDGVLVDSYRAEFDATFGQTSRDIIRNLWGDAIPDDEIAPCDDQKESLYRDIIREAFPAMAGADELLASLDEAGFALAIGSSGPPANVATVLECLAEGGRFAAQVTGMDVTRGKPDPQVFLIAAEKLGVAPSRCIVVEDAIPSLQAARAAGMAAVA
jgi:beta-phosphoglucomutase